MGNGVVTTYSYDLAGRLTALVNRGADDRLISFYNYEFDQLSRRTRMISRDGTWDYEYDLTGQLVHAVFTSENPEIASRQITYVYDQVGNRIREIVDGSIAEYSTNNMKQYHQAGGFSYGYDADGNLISKTDGTDSWTYEYNDDNRFIYTSGPEGETEYFYNGLGQLVTTIKDGVETSYLVDPAGFGNVVGEYDETGALVNRYTHGLGLVAQNDYYYTFDGNGNTSEMTNAASEVVNFYLYEPFGKSLYQDEQIENQFEFVGQFGIIKVAEDLMYMRNRFYAADLGRFLSEDPIGLTGGDVSFYRYVLNNPVNRIDPEGLEFIIIGKGDVVLRPRWRLPPRFRFNPKPKPNNLPKPGPPKWEPTDPPSAEDLGAPPDDFYWQQDPAPPKPKPYNPNNPPKPMAPIPPWEDFGNLEEPYDRIWNRGGCT